MRVWGVVKKNAAVCISHLFKNDSCVSPAFFQQQFPLLILDDNTTIFPFLLHKINPQVYVQTCTYLLHSYHIKMGCIDSRIWTSSFNLQYTEVHKIGAVTEPTQSFKVIPAKNMYKVSCNKVRCYINLSIESPKFLLNHQQH